MEYQKKPAAANKGAPVVSIRAKETAQAVEGTEEQTQATIVAWCRAQVFSAPEVAEVWHMPNYRRLPGTGAQRARAVAWLRKLGFADGYPDLGWDVARGRYHGLRIELKKGRRRPSAAQRARIELLRRRGYAAEVCYGFDDAVAVIEKYFSLP